MTFLSAGSDKGLSYPRNDAILEYASTVASLTFISALNFLVPKCFFYFAESQGFLGWSRIASLCFGHRTVALLSFSFSPSDFCFLLAFLYLLSVAGIKGVGYPGYPVLTVTSSCGPRNGLFEQASNNGVPESEAAPFLAGTCIRTSAVSELPLHETSILSSQPLLDVIIFCGQSKNGNVLHLKTEE